MSKKKICIIGPFPPIKGGISQYNDFLARELQKKSDIYLFSYKRQYPEFLIKNRAQIDENSIESRELKDKIDFTIDSINPFTWAATLQKIRKINPDLVILPWWVIYWAPMYIVFLSVFRVLNIKSLLLCHNVYEHEDHAIKRWISQSVFKLANFYLVHSTSEKNKLLPLIAKKRLIQHLHPLYQYSTNNLQVCSSPVEEGQLNLLFFGFVRKYKGLDILLNALQIINDDKVNLKVVGEFWSKKEEYINFIEQNNINNVEIIEGYIADNEVDKFFLEADVVVLPYRSATGSGVIAVSYGFGKPVLVTNIGGLAEAVDFKKTGYIAEANPVDIAKGIQWFIKNKESPFADNIESFVTEHMSWSGLVGQIYDLVEKK